jgi:hypothetical protein
MNFATVKSITIPEGNVASISRGSEVLWRKKQQKYKKRLLYLESTGTQYLDTKIIGKSGIRAFLDFEFISGDLADYIIFGSASNKWANRFYPVSARDGAWVLGYGARISATSAPVLGQRYAVESELSVGKQTMVVDGNTLISSANTTSIDTKMSMYLFAVHSTGDGGTVKIYGGSRIYSCWIEAGGVLVRDLIPVLDWDDVPCMFDNVSEEFFYNIGTGTFKWGEL